MYYNLCSGVNSILQNVFMDARLEYIRHIIIGLRRPHLLSLLSVSVPQSFFQKIPIQGWIHPTAASHNHSEMLTWVQRCHGANSTVHICVRVSDATI